jgi:hypothetical protein
LVTIARHRSLLSHPLILLALCSAMPLRSRLTSPLLSWPGNHRLLPQRPPSTTMPPSHQQPSPLLLHCGQVPRRHQG